MGVQGTLPPSVMVGGRIATENPDSSSGDSSSGSEYSSESGGRGRGQSTTQQTTITTSSIGIAPQQALAQPIGYQPQYFQAPDGTVQAVVPSGYGNMAIPSGTVINGMPQYAIVMTNPPQSHAAVMAERAVANEEETESETGSGSEEESEESDDLVNIKRPTQPPIVGNGQRMHVADDSVPSFPGAMMSPSDPQGGGGVGSSFSGRSDEEKADQMGGLPAPPPDNNRPRKSETVASYYSDASGAYGNSKRYSTVSGVSGAPGTPWSEMEPPPPPSPGNLPSTDSHGQPVEKILSSTPPPDFNARASQSISSGGSSRRPYAKRKSHSSILGVDPLQSNPEEDEDGLGFGNQHVQSPSDSTKGALQAAWEDGDE